MSRTFRRVLLVGVTCVALTAAHARAAAADPVVYAAGDIVCDPADPAYNGGNGTTTKCRQKATLALLAPPYSAVLTLGDLQYNAGSLANFQNVYSLTWGTVKPLTRPVIGNHEGTTATTGAGYCVYFGAAAHCNANRRQGGAAFYSFDLGTWHVVVVNSNCDAAGGCGPGSAQYNWLAADLAAHPRACTLAAWHHPRWNSGTHGSTTIMQPIWQLLYASGADLVLSGHAHDYERFAPLGPTGAVNRADGIRQFVVGTGGANFTGLGAARVNGSEVAQNTSFGVLRLALHPTSYDWRFVPAPPGAFRDSGSQSCRRIPPDIQAPTVPGGLRATLATRARVDLAWGPAADNVGVIGYEVWRATGTDAAVSLASAAGTAFADANIEPSTTYRYQVRARDAAGNLSPLSGPVAVRTPALKRRLGKLLARYQLEPRVARRGLRHGWVKVRRRDRAHTVIRVRVGRRLAARRHAHTRRALVVHLASWSHQRRYRHRTVTVTIRRPF
jgi:acid phosphatase type 7